MPTTAKPNRPPRPRLARSFEPEEVVLDPRELIRRMGAMADHVEGKKLLAGVRVTDIERPPVPARNKEDVRALREKLRLSQAAFAVVLNVPLKTAISWETGARKPSGAALKLLHIADHSPEILLR